MTPSKDRMTELSELLIKSLEGTISQKHFSQFEAILEQNDDHIDKYLDLLANHALLKHQSSRYFQLISPDVSINVQFLEELAEYEKNGIPVEVERIKEPVERVLTEEERKAKIRAFIREERAMEEQEWRLEEEARRKIRKRELRKRQRAQRARVIVTRVRRYLRNALIAAMLMVIGYLVYAIKHPPPPAFVATLTDGVDVKWDDPQQPTELNSPLRPGPMKLIAGIVQITFDYGAQIIIRGPAEFDLEGDNRAYLQSGKLSANVPPETRGFTVNTPNASIVDLGTEFSVHVKKDGSSDVHVFKGKVSLLAGKFGEMVDKLGEKVAQIVEAGQARRVVKGGEKIEDIVLDRKTFVSRVATGVEAIPLASESSVIKSGPVVYFPFDATDKRRVINRVNNAAIGQLIGKVSFAKTNASDNTVKNEVLKLNGGCVHIDVLKDRGSPDGYTFVMWIQTDITEWQNVFYASKKGRLVNYSKGSLELELFIQEGGTLTLIADSKVLADEKKDLDDVGNIALRPGIWFHVAAVVTSDFAQLYIDGILQEVQWDMPPKMADELLSAGDWEILVGASNLQWSGDATLVEEGFSGFIDEFVIFDRALSEAEITTLYRNTKSEN